MNKLAKKYLRPSQIPTKACHGCGIGMIENWLLQAIDELSLKQEQEIVADTKQWLEEQSPQVPVYGVYLDAWCDWQNPWETAPQETPREGGAP